ncbi:hypothetical protein PsAD2_04000 [Pseudovibrio axinellae]|uniref:Uncharacterized protein n=1 Tax=Pseudovibrio axinellae TaxID=989403 RepID=A0A161X9Y1_9HYPH|nr:hypothetical protein [Pseudovibrio axinellae]KZL10341.1 hypothetical protein PsAD2_04000 [Pseudovibrio axinellae]SER81595.1 hypothetical protein SAMN05421798_12710 [Pseudovibrio axinellae]
MRSTDNSTSWYCEGCKTFHLNDHKKWTDDMGDFYCARAWKRLTKPQNNTFRQRVNYAREAFLLGEDSRAFDKCFEMYDGAFVVTALMRLCQTDTLLNQAIQKQMSRPGVIAWQKTAASLAHIPSTKLSQKAAAHRVYLENRAHGYVQPSLL